MTTDSMHGRPLRADAERNRLRIIAAARELFAQRGLEVSLDEVADAAEVGVGTVYRRFANRDELIAAVLVEHLRSVVATSAEIVDADDPWAAVVDLMMWLVETMAADRGMAAIMVRVDHSHPDIEAAKRQMLDVIERMFRRAHTAGVIRPDLAATDFVALLTMLLPVVEATRSVAPGAWRRYLDLMLDAIRPGPGRSPLGAPPITVDQLTQVTRDQREAQRWMARRHAD